jgi:cytochrome c-type biogenesis protein CcsB
MFYNKKWINKSIRIIKWIIISGIFIHTLGLVARWIISGHAPWTNGYEAMIYTVWATMLAGLIFSRKSDLTLSATTLVSSMLLLFTWISYLDPTITNVVPVLNSYWLMIHVSIIVSSYGFLIMGGFLGLLSLILMIFKSNKNKEIINSKISELTIINEKTLIIGLFMLTIGTFLGGVWANESWGRYWGWDAKETWALVSILVYSFILHMRFVPGLQSKHTFNLASVIGIYSVLMTYFGVNHLLSGLHSYGAGEDVGIPNYIWISVLIVIIIAILAKLNNNKK